MIYFDNAATTELNRDIKSNILKYYDNYANASAQHSLGKRSKFLIEEARNIICEKLKLKNNNLIFTSGATESNNLAVKGLCLNNNGEKKEIIISKMEHSSMKEPITEMKKYGYTIKYVNTLKDGTVDINHLEELINKNTFLVSIMSVNSETGMINDTYKISKIIYEKSKIYGKIFYISDMCQSILKLDICTEYIDIITGSFHKINGPNGLGFLWCKNLDSIKSIITGGNQEKRKKAGTEPLYNILLARDSVIYYFKNINEINKKLKKLNDYFINKIKDFKNIEINGDIEKKIDSITNISIKGYDSNFLLTFFDMNDICVSIGSACNSGLSIVSETLKSIGYSEDRIKSSIRISFGIYNEIDEIDEFINLLKKLKKE